MRMCTPARASRRGAPKRHVWCRRAGAKLRSPAHLQYSGQLWVHPASGSCRSRSESRCSRAASCCGVPLQAWHAWRPAHGTGHGRPAPHALRRLVRLQQAAQRALGGGQRAVEHVHEVLALRRARRARRAQPHVQPPRLRRQPGPCFAEPGMVGRCASLHMLHIRCMLSKAPQHVEPARGGWGLAARCGMPLAEAHADMLAMSSHDLTGAVRMRRMWCAQAPRQGRRGKRLWFHSVCKSPS